MELGTTSMEGAAPERTCVGCREQDSREALLRFAVRPAGDGPRLVPDIRRRLPGRGVSVHPTHACITRAVQRGGFARAIKGPPGVDAPTLIALVVRQYDRRLEGLLASAARQRRVAVGTDTVRRALDEGSVALLWTAEDAAGRSDELARRAAEASVATAVRWNKEKLGALLRRSEVGVLAIQDHRIALEVGATLQRATNVSEAE